MPGSSLPKTGRLLACLAVGVLALTGCGGGDPQPQVATAASPGAPSATPAGSTGAVGEYLAATRKWVACMREQGFQLPDPDARGHVDINLRQLGVVKTDRRFVDAQKKCLQFNLPVPEELEEKEVVTAEMKEHRKAYAACMRQYGDPKFADPRPDGSWPRDEPGAAAPSEEESARGYKAGLICQPVLDGKPADPDATEPPDAKG
jgi:hypothetical protein